MSVKKYINQYHKWWGTGAYLLEWISFRNWLAQQKKHPAWVVDWRGFRDRP